MATTEKKMSRMQLTAMVVGGMVGAGIFSLPRTFANATGPLGAVIAWLIAGTGMYMLARVFQSLAERKPDLDAGVFAYAKAGFGDVQGGRRNIENRKIVVPAGQQVVDERRLASADVDKLRIAIRSGFLDEPKRYVQVRAIPTHLAWSLRSVHPVPVRFGVHDLQCLRPSSASAPTSA